MKLNMLIGTLMLGTSLCTPSFGGGLLDRMLGLKGSGCDSACCDTGCSADPSCGCEIASCGGGCEPSCGVEMSACGDACDTGCKLGSRLGKLIGGGPSCGCEIAACDPCGAAPTCGCELSACGSAPSCGCEIASCDPCGCDTGCSKPRRKPLLELLCKAKAKKHALFAGLHRSGCDSGCASACEPSCGVDMGPSCGCEMSACAAPTCGCEISSCDPCGCDSGCGAKKCGGLLSKLFKRKNSSCCDSGCDSCAVASSGCAGGCSSCGSSSAAPVSAPVIHGDAAPMPPAPIVDPSAYLQSNRRVIQATSYVR